MTATGTRVTMNQTLLAALGQSFTSDNNLTPLSEVGLALVAHHHLGRMLRLPQELDPMRMFFGNQYDFNDRDDFVANPFSGSQPNPRPAGPAAGGLRLRRRQLGQPLDGTQHVRPRDAPPTGRPIKTRPESPVVRSLFALSVAQRPCFWGNSDACSPATPPFAPSWPIS